MSLPPSYNLLAKYPNRWFVETGSFRGDAIHQALDAGFRNIRSMDIDPANIAFCASRFDLKNQRKPHIQIYSGDSAEDLWSIIADITEPITFWLDGHWQMIEGEEPGPNPFPLLKELEQISMHPIKSHTLIIDDWHIFYQDRVGYSKDDIKRSILSINTNYKFRMTANPVIDGILIASL